jgi:hypothetical protein
MQLSRRTQMMATFRGRMQLAAEAAAAERAAKVDPVDPWHAVVGHLKGRVTKDGVETISMGACLDALAVPLPARSHDAFRRLAKLMRVHGWERCRVRVNGRQARGYRRRTANAWDAGPVLSTPASPRPLVRYVYPSMGASRDHTGRLCHLRAALNQGPHR